MQTDSQSPNLSEKDSYSTILRSSSIVGGAQALNYVVGLIRVKFVAVLLGPTGVGLIGLYQSALSLVGTVSGLGIKSSGVREVARAQGKNDPVAVATTVRILRRACWATGLIGWGLAAILSRQISEWVFGNQDHALAIALLGATLLVGAVSGGQLALLQGIRRIGDLARTSVVAMLINTVVTLAIYAWLGRAGIVPVLLVTACISLTVSWWFARRVRLDPIRVDLHETMSTAGELVSLGFAFMWGALLAAGVDLFTRSLIVRDFGVDAAGIYQAAWALSGLFAGFVLGAMGADFYPRLTAAIGDRPKAIRMVNEQIEIGILLALPGILVTIALAPLAMRLLYTSEFLPAAALLPWFLVGVFGRVVSWPLGFIQLAEGATRWFFATQTVFSMIQLVLVVALVPQFGLVGVAYSFAALYAVQIPAILWVSSRLIGFRWSSDVRRMLAFSGLALAACVAISIMLEGWSASTVGTGVAVVVGLCCIRGLVNRLGANHQLTRAFMHIPGATRLLRMSST